MNVILKYHIYVINILDFLDLIHLNLFVMFLFLKTISCLYRLSYKSYKLEFNIQIDYRPTTLNMYGGRQE